MSINGKAAVDCRVLATVTHDEFLLGNIRSLFGDIARCPSSCDVAFLVEGQLFRAHGIILAAQSDYFRTLLFDNPLQQNDKAKQTPISLGNKRALPFGHLLSYLYTGRLNLTNLDIGNVVNLLEMAHEYQLLRLFNCIVDYLKAIIDVDNIFYIYFEVGLLFDANELVDECRRFIYEHAGQLVESDHFYALPSVALAELVSRDEFSLPELDILMAVVRWVDVNGIDESTKSVLEHVRFDLINFQTTTMAEAKPAFDLLHACGVDITKQPATNTARHRTFVATQNMARRHLGAKVLRDGNVQNRRAMISGRYVLPFCRQNPDILVHSYHPLDERSFIVIALSRPCLVSSMLIDLPAINAPASPSRWNYVVETSLDNLNWQPLADCTSCSGSQLLVFNHRKLRFIKVIGYLKPSEAKTRFGHAFCIINFECPATVTAEERETIQNFRQKMSQSLYHQLRLYRRHADETTDNSSTSSRLSNSNFCILLQKDVCIKSTGCRQSLLSNTTKKVPRKVIRSVGASSDSNDTSSTLSTWSWKTLARFARKKQR